MSGITGQPVPSLGPPQHFHTRLVKCTTLRTKEEEKAATPPNLFFRFLSDISELVAPPLVPKGQPKVKVFIHLVRHAQAEHNVQSMTSKERDAMLNPPLTALGYNQCAVLSRKFPYMDQITHVIVSPLRRTLETLHAAFGPVIDRETPVVVWQDVKEWGYGNCNRGAPRVILNKQLSTPNVDLSLLWPGYQNNRDSGSRRLKALQIRDALVDFTNVALVGGEWKGVPVAKAEDGKDVHLLVVSHGNIMSALVTSGANVIGTQFSNTGVRSFEVFPHQPPPKKKYLGIWGEKEQEEPGPWGVRTIMREMEAGNTAHPEYPPDPFVYLDEELERTTEVTKMFDY